VQGVALELNGVRRCERDDVAGDVATGVFHLRLTE
jgi:hypothetical protein